MDFGLSNHAPNTLSNDTAQRRNEAARGDTQVRVDQLLQVSRNAQGSFRTNPSLPTDSLQGLILVPGNQRMIRHENLRTVKPMEMGKQ